MNKTEIIDAIARRTKLPRPEVEEVLASFFDTTKQTLRTGEEVRLSGFGTFVVIDRKEHLGRNPVTGETITIPSRKTAKFRVGKVFKAFLKA